MSSPFTRSLRPAILLSVAIALSACGSATRLDATSTETLKDSLDLARAGYLTKAEQERFDQARALYEATYLAPDAEIQTNPYLPEWDIVHDMRPGEFVRFVDGIRSNAVVNESPEPESPFPNPAFTWRLLEQYQLERTLLTQARDRIQERGKNTINQYPIVDFAFFPPSYDMPVEFDKARFLVTLRNDSGFDAYRPTFSIRVHDPRDDLPLLDRTFAFDKLEDPIGPGESRMLEMSCCGVTSDPFHNNILKNLPGDASIEVNLVTVMNHGTTQILETNGFTMKDFLRLGVVTRCIAQIQGNEATWVPGGDDDEPGGCGDPTRSGSGLGLAGTP